MSEFAPGSPWKAIFSLLMISPVRASTARRKQRARLLQVLGRIDAEDHIGGERDIDAHAGFERAQLLEPFALLQYRWRQLDEARQCFAPVCVEADVMIQRPFAGGRGRARGIERAE